MLNVCTHEPSLLDDLQPLLAEVLRRLQQQFAEELVSVVVYGSYARGEADTSSDIDLMVVVLNLPHEWQDIFVMEDSLTCMGLSLGKRLDIRLVEPQAVSYSVTWAAPLMLEVYDAHYIIFDSMEFFAAEMKRFAKVMRERGVYKLRSGAWRVPSLAHE
ncbi:nucleotidyltransferase domain-containing protein [Candidatus Poribacteria bacterium]|nr:nucleotidyltransferase domain-containing protein [Candidatus Poribacteria bacterium]